MVDMRPEFVSPSGRGTVINPTAVIVKDPQDALSMRLHVAARVHWLTVTQEADLYSGDMEEYLGQLITRIDHIWHSSVVVGEAVLSKEFLATWPTTGAKVSVTLESTLLTDSDGYVLFLYFYMV